MFISLEGDKDVWMLRACLIAQSEVIHLDKERNLAPFAFFWAKSHRTVEFLMHRWFNRHFITECLCGLCKNSSPLVFFLLQEFTFCSTSNGASYSFPWHQRAS